MLRNRGEALPGSSQSDGGNGEVGSWQQWRGLAQRGLGKGEHRAGRGPAWGPVCLGRSRKSHELDLGVWSEGEKGHSWWRKQLGRALLSALGCAVREGRTGEAGSARQPQSQRRGVCERDHPTVLGAPSFLPSISPWLGPLWPWLSLLWATAAYSKRPTRPGTQPGWGEWIRPWTMMPHPRPQHVGQTELHVCERVGMSEMQVPLLTAAGLSPPTLLSGPACLTTGKRGPCLSCSR